jgi:hypothetical protein
MTRVGISFRSLVAGVLLAASSVGCQAIFGDYKIDDSAFHDAGGSGNAAGSSSSSSAGGGDTGDGGPQDGMTGPIHVMPTSGLFTTEWGGQARFSVVCAMQPTADVTVALSSSNEGEGKMTPASLTFTKDDWNAPQIVTVTGVDDTLPDGNQAYEIITAPAKSDDPIFNGFDPANVELTNIDNETSGVSVIPTTGLVTSESGARDTFTVALNSAPKSNVTIGLSSSKPTEGTVSPISLVFTPDNWMAPQLVTVTGVDDTVKDGPQAYTIVTAPAVSDDPTYQGVDPADVSVTNLDNETAGVVVTLVSGIDPNDPTKLRTSEGGDMATFTVMLTAPPSDDVTIPVTSSTPTEGTVSTASLKFTTLNYMSPQTVTVTGVDDSVADGDQPYTVVLGAPTTKDTDYTLLGAENVQVTNVDNDKPGFSVTLVSGIDPADPTRLDTTEGGGAATFKLALNSKPLAAVTVKLSSSTPTEGTVSPATLTFSTDNWNAPQTVTVTGVDDKVEDGDQQYSVLIGAATSTDKGYQGLDPPDVSVTNKDNDSAGVIVTPATGIDPNPGQSAQLVTSEGGDTATFVVSLTSQPTGNVTIAVSSSNTKEGTVSPATLTFTQNNYAAPQVVTVTGVDDKVQDGNTRYEVALAAASSKDANYNGKFATQVTVTNLDNDSAGIFITPTSGLTTSESGASATFTIVLNSQPTASVTIGLSSTNTAEGTVGVSSVKFTTSNWNAPQKVTVTGVQDDGTADGNQAYRITTAAATSTDPNYNGMDPPDVSLTNLDDDTAGIIVKPTSGLTTKENGATATFTIVLQSKPTASVRIGVSSNRTSEGTVSPASLTFSTANWNAPQAVTVTGVDDAVQDGNQLYTIVTGAASSMDLKYNGVDPPDVSVTNIDDDSAGVTVVPPLTPTTTEKGGTASFTVALTSQPTATVTIALSSTNTGEGTVGTSSLTFTTANWAAAQTVTVTGVNDAVQDGDQPYKILLANAVSTDLNFNGKFATQVNLTNIDDDSAGVQVIPPASATTTENGGTSTFKVVLNSQPTATVTIGVSSSNPAEGTASPSTLTFTTVNWAAPQSVTVTGVDDSVQDGDQTYLVKLANAVSADTNYGGRFATSISFVNVDNDQAGVTVNAAPGLQTGENGATATFTVVLNSQPTAAVTIALSSTNTAEGTVSPALLTFSVAAWSVAQTVTVTGVDDAVADGNQAYSVLLANAGGGDPNYAGKFATHVDLINVDNDSAGVEVSAAANLQTTEKGGQATFTVVLNSQPTAAVTIAVSSSRPSEGTVAPASLAFSTSDWSTPQTVTVTGVDDQIADGPQPYTVQLAAAVSADTGYSGKFATHVDLTNADDDTLGILVTPTTCSTTPGTTATVMVVLTSQPQDTVTIPISSNTPTEGTVSANSLVFTAANWNVAQSVTVTGVADGTSGAMTQYLVVTGAATSAGDAGYNGYNATDVTCTNSTP